ncbi:MAG: pseudouridine synthase, partial [Candidatus Saccharimonadales bacterium]
NRERLSLPAKTTTILLNKPVGFVVSRKGQGAKTIYDLLPVDLSSLKPVGRLDKDSSGLIMLTNDGLLANSLTHPSMNKQKLYLVSLDKPLAPRDLKTINDGIRLSDGVSHLTISDLAPDSRSMNLNMVEGRNRQIRRTFESLGYKVIKLHRVQFGQFRLNDLESGRWFEVKN